MHHMCCCKRAIGFLAIILVPAAFVLAPFPQGSGGPPRVHGAVSVSRAETHDESRPLATLQPENERPSVEPTYLRQDSAEPVPLQDKQKNLLTAAAVEQTTHGTKPPPETVASFDGL